jgi:hypothetical protein
MLKARLLSVRTPNSRSLQQEGVPVLTLEADELDKRQFTKLRPLVEVSRCQLTADQTERVYSSWKVCHDCAVDANDASCRSRRYG